MWGAARNLPPDNTNLLTIIHGRTPFCFFVLLTHCSRHCPNVCPASHDADQTLRQFLRDNLFSRPFFHRQLHLRRPLCSRQRRFISQYIIICHYSYDAAMASIFLGNYTNAFKQSDTYDVILRVVGSGMGKLSSSIELATLIMVGNIRLWTLFMVCIACNKGLDHRYILLVTNCSVFVSNEGLCRPHTSSVNIKLFTLNWLLA